MIYLNNAATSWPKPDSTIKALQSFWIDSPESWNRWYQESHRTICDFFKIRNTDRFVITSGATAALNMIFTDIDWTRRDIVVTGQFEHHALAGWEYRLNDRSGVEFKKIGCTENDIFDLGSFEQFIRENHRRIKLVAFTQASNITGDLVPTQEILGICREFGILSLLDAAQTAGIVKIDIADLKPDVFLFAGHKGTMGPHGVGGLYVSERVELKIPEVNYNVRGSVQIATHCDVGSVNLEGMVALASSMEHLQSIGFSKLDDIRNRLNARLYDGLSDMEHVEILSKTRLNRTYAIAFRVNNMSVSTVLERLVAKGCIIGGGHFCCAGAHEELETQIEGVLRVSAGPFTTEDEVDEFFGHLSDIVATR